MSLDFFLNLLFKISDDVWLAILKEMKLEDNISVDMDNGHCRQDLFPAY